MDDLKSGKEFWDEAKEKLERASFWRGNGAVSRGDF
jgi:hypothetical protein